MGRTMRLEALRHGATDRGDAMKGSSPRPVGTRLEHEERPGARGEASRMQAGGPHSGVAALAVGAAPGLQGTDRPVPLGVVDARYSADHVEDQRRELREVNIDVDHIGATIGQGPSQRPCSPWVGDLQRGAQVAAVDVNSRASWPRRRSSSRSERTIHSEPPASTP